MGDDDGGGLAADTSKKRAKPPIGSIMFLAVCVVVIVGLPIGLIVGGFQERTVTTPVPGGITTTGKVVDVRVDAITGRGGGSEYAEIEFTDNKGESHTFEATSVSNAPDVGSTVKVSYDPHNPDHAADLSIGSARWIGFVTAGVVLLALEMFWVYWQLRGRARHKDRRVGTT